MRKKQFWGEEGEFMIILTEWHAFISATSSLGKSLYLQSLLLPSFFSFGRRRQKT